MSEYYRVRAVLNKKALRNNIDLIQKKLGKGVRMMAVVKSNAYGHGIGNIIPVCAEKNVDAYAVATIDEGVEVRKLLENMPEAPQNALILVLGYTDPSEYQKALNFDIDLTVYRYDQAEKLSKLAQAMGKDAGVHIKLETGMERIGFAPTDESEEQILRLSKLPGIAVHGIFSHFARADERDKQYADRQWKLYEDFVRALREQGLIIPIHHIANSAAIMEYPKCYQALPEEGETYMARAGIMLYGLYPSEEMDREAMPLQPVMSLHSHVIHLKKVEAGTPIGYGGSFVTKKEAVIATIPVGYGDGYPRHLSNIGSVWIDGRRAPIIGRVCMDQMMVDVSEIPEVRLGDEVQLFGDQLPLDELARLSGTIHYEIVCQLTDRIERMMK